MGDHGCTFSSHLGSNTCTVALQMCDDLAHVTCSIEQAKPLSMRQSTPLPTTG